jgi:hypothetical protein
MLAAIMIVAASKFPSLNQMGSTIGVVKGLEYANIKRQFRDMNGSTAAHIWSRTIYTIGPTAPSRQPARASFDLRKKSSVAGLPRIKRDLCDRHPWRLALGSQREKAIDV